MDRFGGKGGRELSADGGERRQSDPKFREAEQAVREQAGAMLEDEALRRALGGIVRFKFGSDGQPLIDPRTDSKSS